MAQGDELEPGTPLEVPRAARLAGCPEARLRGLMEQGQLLFEVQRRGGKEIQIVRYVDLVDAFPERFVAPGPPGEAPAAISQGSTGPERRVPQADAERPGPQAGPEDPETAEGGARLAALQESQRVLQAQLEDLGEQRARLRQQGDELRQQLVRVEQERQASTAGLLMMQQRLMELEAGPVVTLDRPAYRRPLVWWAVGSGLVLVLALQSIASMRRSFAAHSDGLSARMGEAQRALEAEVSAASRERARARAAAEAQDEAQERAFDQWLIQQEQRLREQQERMREDREAFAAALEAERRSAEALRLALDAQLEVERQGSAEERQRAAAKIADLESRAASAWQRLEDERAQAAAESAEQAAEIEARIEREARARGVLDGRLAQMQESLDATTRKALALEVELEQERRLSRAKRGVARALRQFGNQRRGLTGPLDLLRRQAHLWSSDPQLYGPSRGPK